MMTENADKKRARAGFLQGYLRRILLYGKKEQKEGT